MSMRLPPREPTIRACMPDETCGMAGVGALQNAVQDLTEQAHRWPGGAPNEVWSAISAIKRIALDAERAPPREPTKGSDCGHGHVYLRADGVRARCGGPGLCSLCSIDKAQKDALDAAPAPDDLVRRLRHGDHDCQLDVIESWMREAADRIAAQAEQIARLTRERGEV